MEIRGDGAEFLFFPDQGPDSKSQIQVLENMLGFLTVAHGSEVSLAKEVPVETPGLW